MTVRVNCFVITRVLEMYSAQNIISKNICITNIHSNCEEISLAAINYFVLPAWRVKQKGKKKIPYLSTQSESREQWLEAGAS